MVAKPTHPPSHHQYNELITVCRQVWTEEGEEESEMTCSERLQAELQDDPGRSEIFSL